MRQAKKPLLESLFEWSESHGEEVALWGRSLQSEAAAEVTWQDLLKTVRELAAGWIRSGLEEGEPVILDLPHTLEWPILHLSILMAGGISVPLDGAREGDSFEESFMHCGARFVVTCWSPCLRVLASKRDSAETAVCEVHYVQGALGEEAAAIPENWRRRSLRISALRERGRSEMELFPESCERRLEGHTLRSPALVHYTPGTEGKRRGVLLDVGNLVYECAGVAQRLDLRQEPGGRQLVVMPNHTVWGSLALWLGLRVGQSMKLLEDRCLEPEVFDGWPLDLVLGAPATFERILELTVREELGSSFVTRKLSSWAKDMLSEKRQRSLLARLPGEVAAGVMRRQLRRLFGGEETRLVCAGMTPPQELQRVYREAGFPLLSGYGLTQSSGFTHLNTPNDLSQTTVGKVLEGVGSRLSPEGEILVKGRSVFAGYWREDEELHARPDGDGWLPTGDVGVEEEGGLMVLGRKQHLFETASGHPVAPLPLEADLEAHTGVRHAVIVGEGRPYVSAILELERRSTGGIKKRKVPDTDKRNGGDELVNEVRRLVDDLNSKIPRQERIRAFRVVDSLMPAGEEGGALGRPKREVVLRNHAQLIEDIYRLEESPSR